MSVSSINNTYAANQTAAPASTSATESTTAKNEETTNTASESASTGFSDTAAVYEKNSDKTSTESVKKKDHSAIVAQLKADQEARQKQLLDIVQKTISQQGQTFGLASGDDMWKFLAKGNFTVSADVKSQAMADIADDGYWGVEQTSDRILDFAKALAADDPDQADKLFDAFKKGFSQATKSWGQKLPDISQRTYDAVEKKFNEWKNSAKKTTTETSAVEDASNVTA